MNREMTIQERHARIEREEMVFDDMLPGMKEASEEFEVAIESMRDIYRESRSRLRRQIVRTPYQRLMLAGRLIDMCDADAAGLLNKEIDQLSFDDVLESISGLATKVRVLKARAARAARAELPKAAE